MKCPDCDRRLLETAVVDMDHSFRCESCGGTWVAPWVVNRVAEGETVTISPREVARGGLQMGTATCPEDQVKLVAVSTEQVPYDLRVLKCDKCGWWWFPGNDLFLFQDAYEVKRNYYRMWRKPELLKWVLPALAVLVLVVGLSGGVALVKNSSQTTIGASVGVTQFSVTYLGESRELVAFKTERIIETVEQRKVGELNWEQVPVKWQGGEYVVRLTNLEYGAEYEVRILGKIYTFTVGS